MHIFCRLNNFWKFNRNLRRIVSNERDDLRTRLLKSGRLACVSALDEWPRTLHERRTFTVDLTIFTVSTLSHQMLYISIWYLTETLLPFQPQMIVFTITGLFKEITGDPDSGTPISMQSYELRHFMRTFVVVPQNSGFCIRNETIFITSASTEQTREFKRSQHQPAPGAAGTVITPNSRGAVNVDTSSLQNRLQQGHGPTGAVALLPSPSTQPSIGAAAGPVAAVAAGAGTEAARMQMVQAMCAHSQMNVEWSRK